MGGYGPPSRVMPNRLSSISMLMVWTVTPPCCSFIRFRCSNRPPGGEHAKKNQQRNDFHFFLILCQASMTPTLLVELGLEAIRHPRRPRPIGHVTPRAGRTGGTAGAGMLAFPWPTRMAFTYLAAVLAQRAFHGLQSSPGVLPRISHHVRFGHARVRPTVWSGPTCVVRTALRVGPLFVTI